MRIIGIISANKRLMTVPVPIRSFLAQLGLKLLDDAVKQMRGKRVGHFALQMPVTRDQEFLLSQLAFCHQTALRHIDAERTEQFQ
ncbi:hypothetical protein XH97_32890 [Bradyrhizobium sp. CCBAU 53380]|nr:hypothetical protein [Bradyrhizobium sp. CCBAU 53380]